MASANGFGLTSAARNIVFAYDVGDTYNCYLGEPTTNQLTVLGTPGPGAASDNAVNFAIQGTSGFIRMGYGQTFGNYTIQPGDVVYKYNLGSYGCHYHGNTASIPAGVQATFSFEYYLSPDVSIETSYLANFENYGGNGLSGGIGVPNTTTGVWHKASFTSGPTAGTGTQAMFLYPGGCGGRLSATGFILYKNPQVEWKPYPTQFVQGTRSSTQSLFNLRNQTGLNVGSVSFTNTPYTPQIIFDGTDDRIDVGYYSPVNNSLSRSWEVIVRPTSTMTYAGVFGNKLGYGCTYYCNGGIYLWDGNWVFNWYDNSSYQFLYSSVTPAVNAYTHIVGTYDASDQKPRIYVNGELKATYGSSTNMDYGGATYVIDIAYNSSGLAHYFQGQIPVAKYYQDKALSLSEVQNNYQNYKSRFNLS